ncbi:hypothetical protein ACU635_49515 [[Actinomadura] parvosata]|uniref:hypothetical protein n=1 Tax=[Actinomadura] parvosata TaxID=1955412 RepID=UPI00406C71DF
MEVSDLHSLTMTRWSDRLGVPSLVVACLVLFVGNPVVMALEAPIWTTVASGGVAMLLAWPGLRGKPTTSTVSNRSRSFAGLVVGAMAVGVGLLYQVVNTLWP